MPPARTICLWLSLLASTPSWAKAPLNIAAAISLKPLLESLLPTFRSTQKVEIRASYGASGVLSRQIAQGAPMDIFLSGAPEHIDSLEKDHRTVPGSRREIARGAMVLVTSVGQTHISRFEDLADVRVKRIATGDPKTVPAGSYATDILTFLGLSPRLDLKLVRASHARQILTYVERGDVDAAIVYRSDALSSPKVRIAAHADPRWHRPVLYEAAIIQRSETHAQAETFLHFLSAHSNSQIRAELVRHGLDQPHGNPSFHGPSIEPR